MDLYLIEEIEEKEKWHNLLLQFEDANFYQLWNYGKFVHQDDVSHLAFYNKDELVGLTQIRFKLTPLFKKGIAYIFAGPLWRKKNVVYDINRLKSIYFTLRFAYCINNKFYLRINPNIFEDDEYYKDLSLDGFSKRKVLYNHRTIFLNLDRDLDEIRMSFKQRFRKTLNRAERKDIEVIFGTEPQLFNDFITLYNQLTERKRFKVNVNPLSLIEFNNQLDLPLKAVVFIAKVSGQPVSALIGSAIGTTGIALFSASNEDGMKVGASNLLHWERIKWFKQKGCKRYDLGGVDPNSNKSVYEFKRGISQNEYAHIGVFEASDSFLFKQIVHLAEFMKNKF
ncbi:MAG: hypothetical protein KatS3mg002_1559 [Candidatus Woesearchaeota archaeon]|nr:MAG: hypothetical protein KatS3mg002_1559 [Candidatus Woesearchaeota archaeon]